MGRIRNLKSSEWKKQGDKRKIMELLIGKNPTGFPDGWATRMALVKRLGINNGQLLIRIKELKQEGKIDFDASFVWLKPST